MARRGTAKPQEETASNPQIISASESGQQRGNGPTGERGGGSGGKEHMDFSFDEIAQRAYQIYEREGRMDGRDMYHWLRAERELGEERKRGTIVTPTQPQATGLSRSEGDQGRALAGTSRPPRPDEAPRSARRHQPTGV